MKNNPGYLDNHNLKIPDKSNIIGCRATHKKCKLYVPFISESERIACTTMRFSSGTGNSVKEKAVAQNYDYFIHTMAEMVKKYAPEILE